MVVAGMATRRRPRPADDPQAAAAIETAATIMATCRSQGMTAEQTRELFTEASAFADGRLHDPSGNAVALYEAIRAKSTGDGESIALFIRMVKHALDMIDVRLVTRGDA